MSIVDDLLAEDREQFELYFQPITPSGSATVGDPDTVCVNLEDNDSMIVALSLSSIQYTFIIIIILVGRG